jgi:hypothetical protein
MKKSIYLIIILLISSCTQDITSPDSVSEFKATFFDYLPDSASLYLYTEIENVSNAYSIDSVWAQVYKQNIGLVFSTELTNPYSDDDGLQTTKVYSYQGNPGFASGNYYVKYYLRETNGGALSLSTNIKFLSAYEGNAVPEYINLDVPDIFYIDNSEWQELPIYLTIFDLNGKDDIKSIKYEIKRSFNGCYENVDCDINDFVYLNGSFSDLNCHENLVDDDFWSDEDDTWKLTFVEYVDEGFKYAVILYMRPLNGIAYQDENNDFPAKDCGRTGEFYIRFIIEDDAENIVISDEISVAIIAP